MAEVICRHIEVRAESVVHTIRDPRDPTQQALIWAFHTRASCAACGQQFKFLGPASAVPPDPLVALESGLGAWTSPVPVEMACMVAPFEESALAGMQPLGSA